MSVIAKTTFVIDAVETQPGKGAGGNVASLQHLIDQRAVRRSGTANGQVDLVYSDTLVIGVTPTDLDLTALLSELDGSAVAFAEVTGIYIRHGGTLDRLLIGGDVNSVGIFSAAAHVLELGPGGLFTWESPLDGVAVVNASSDILQLAASANTISADVLILGRSA